MDRREFLGLSAGGVAALGIPALLQAEGDLSLADLAWSRGLQFGSAVSRKVLRKRKYARLIDQHCDVLTGENAFKWRHLEPRERRPERYEADWIINFARDHGKRLRGHCFLWNHHDRMPAWLVDQAAGTARRDHQEITRHMWRQGAFLAREYPMVECWDAMNEAVDPSTGAIRETHFTRLLGDRFFDLAFRIMGEKAPGARLVYNETMNWEISNTHRDGVLRFLERGLRRGLPIHALGIQSHIGKTLNRLHDERVWRSFLEEVEGMGLDVLLTEFDCSDRNVADSSKAKRDAEVAAHCKAYLDLTLSFTNVRELIVWSLADASSYMNRRSYSRNRRRADGLPLRGHPFGERLEPKPMLKAMVSALSAAPMRRRSGG